jgi:hypothetical protein
MKVEHLRRRQSSKPRQNNPKKKKQELQKLQKIEKKNTQKT